MASVDAGQYSLSSDEKLSEFECNPCKDDGVVREATYYCPECSEYFCSSCESSLHRRLKATKSHTILPANEAVMTTKDDAERKSANLPIMTCACNQDILVDYVCDEHKYLVCTECKIMNHRKCKTDAIAEKSKYDNRENLKTLLQTARNIEDEANKFCIEYSENLEMFEASKSKCMEKIAQIRDQLVTFIDKLANGAIDKLDAASTKNQNTDVAACKTMIDKLNHDQKFLQTVIESGEHRQMYIAEFILQESFKNYQSLLDEVKTEMKLTTVTFKANADLIDIQRKFKNIGDVAIEDKLIRAKHVPKCLLKLKAEKKEKFDITPSGVKRMTGATFLPTGDLVVCDHTSRSVILLDLQYKEKSRISMSGRIWGVSVIDENNIIVSHTDLKKLELVEVVPALKLKSSIKVGRMCFDVKVIDSKIYVVCTDDPGDGEIRVLDMDGNVLKRLGYNQDGSYLFQRPIHMACNYIQNKIFVRDISSQKQVVCMSVDGDIIYDFSNAETKSPRGILVDEEGNFMLCSYDTIQLVEAGGSKCTTFLTKDDGINEEPYTLCYREYDKSLVVLCQTKLLVFKLTKKSS